MKKSIKSTVILNKINLNGFLDLNFKSDFDKVMEVLNKLMVENNDEQ